MLITEKTNPGKMLAELLRGPRVPPAATERFAEWKHNEYLCPKLAEQVKAMLSVFEAYGHGAYDVQGFQDKGVDVLMIYEDEDGKSRRVGLQVKSESEFRAWNSKNTDMIKTIKTQHSNAIHDAKVDDYYLLLCVDAARHKEKIRSVNASLMNFNSCTVVEPEELLNLFMLSSMEVSAWATRELCRRDTILETAIDEMKMVDPDVAFFQIDLTCRVFDGMQVVKDKDLLNIWLDWEDLAEDRAGEEARISEVLSVLNGANLLQGDAGDDTFRIAVDQLPPAVCALYLDQNVRSLASVAQMRDHLVRLMDLKNIIHLHHDDYDYEFGDDDSDD